MVSARSAASASAMSSPEGEESEGVVEVGDEEEWEEVGPRNKSTITRRVSGVYVGKNGSVPSGVQCSLSQTCFPMNCSYFVP